jgi:hypothetical protein
MIIYVLFFVEDDLVRKSMQIPKDFLLQMLGEERVTKFAIQEILNCTMADYAKKASDFSPPYVTVMVIFKLISTFDFLITGKLGCERQEG